MSKYFLLKALMGILICGNFLGTHSFVWAGKCALCGIETQGDTKETQCKAGHCLCEECATDFVSRNLDLVVTQEGMGCCGESEGNACQQRLTLPQLRDILDITTKEQLDARILKAKTPDSEASAHEKFQIKKITEGIEEAFNLCCPEEGCGATLDKIAGCNAAECSDDHCKTVFCYLCLKPQANKDAAHDHVATHSGPGKFWEWRDGHTGLIPAESGTAYQEVKRYEVTEKDEEESRRQGKKVTKKVLVERPYTFLDRYHWILARKHLAPIFRDRLEEEVRIQALNEKKAFLEEMRMWPIPAGRKTAVWIGELKASTLPLQNQIELLQNESIYRKEQGDLKNARLLDVEIERLGGRILASLDYKDTPRGGAAVHPPAPVVAQRIQEAQGNQAGHQALGGALVPVREDDPRVPRAFAQLGAGGRPGSMYEIGNLILSDAPDQRMNHADAIRFCNNLGGGARLPTKQEWEEVIKPALSPGGRYDRNSIPNLEGRWFWSSSVRQDNPDGACYFYGNNGNVDYVSRHYDGGGVRCVVPARG